MAYRFLAWLLRTITRVFFRQIEVVGLEHVPAEGPVLFAGNHPNSLIDPIVIATVSAVKPANVDALFPPDHPDRIEESSQARRDADLDAALDKREGA